MGQNRPRRRWTRLLAVLALAIQCFVIQTHIDGLAFAAPVQAAPVVQTIDQHGAIACVICEAAATARTGITPAPAAIALVETTLYLSNAAPELPVIETAPILPWQSRAPPISA